MMPIIHYLTVQVCKRVFIEPNYGVMRSNDPLVIDPDLSMQPLCLLGISVNDFPLNYTEYYEKNDSSCSLSKFLKTFWSRYYKTNGPNIPLVFGIPDILVIDHRVKDIINQSFYSWLDSNNIQYEFSDSKNKKAIANFRQHQHYPYIECYSEIDVLDTYKTKNEEYALPLSVLNTMTNYLDSVFLLSKHRKTLIAYTSRPIKHPTFTECCPNDLRLFDITPLESKADRTLQDAYWVSSDLENGNYGYLRNRQVKEDIDCTREDKKAFLALIKSLPVTQWMDIFTSNQIELLNQLKKQRYKDTIDIDQINYADMCFKLGLSRDSQYTVLALETSKLKRSEMIELWDQYSHGGDVKYSCVIMLPDWYSSRNDKIYRYFYLSMWNSSIIFISESGSPATKCFDQDECINYMSKNQFKIHNLSNIVDIRHFDELLLNNRQYLLNIVKEMDAFELLKDLNTV